jgi:lipopolysaccharide/colanic/teichoic acid biosynthesis glycosyltransferase
MQEHPSKSFVARFQALAGTSTKRRVDLELRILDVVFAVLFGVLALPIALAIAAVVAGTGGFPVLYRGERVGRSGRVFTILKFRTLKRDAETRLGPYLGEELVRRTELEYTRVGGWL